MTSWKNFAVIQSADDHAALRTMIGDDYICVAYDDWIKKDASMRAQCAARGDVLQEAVVNPQDFAKWCGDCGFEMNSTTFGAFVVAEVERQH